MLFFVRQTQETALPLQNITPKRKIMTYTTLDKIVPEEMKWLWHPYIPLGTITAVFGQGGQGKSYMTVDLAARLSRGDAFPDAPAPAAPQHVLMLSAEDDYKTVLVPRLMKAGANLANIAVPDEQFTLDGRGAQNVSELMRSFSATIVFIDPIVYYAGGKMDMNRSNEVRAMMEQLKAAAEAAQASVIIVGHVKKGEADSDQQRMMGSADWVNAARSGLLVGKTNDGTKIMKHVKTNYGELGAARAFTIDNDGFKWGEVYDEDDMPSTSAANRAGTAIAFLRTILKTGPMRSKDVEALAAEAGISHATLNRAKSGVAESYYSKTDGFMWRLLTGSEPPAPKGGETGGVRYVTLEDHAA